MPRKDAELAKNIRARIKKWDDNWRFNKDQYHEFMSFVMGNQWTEDESRLFIDYKKIPLTMNKLAPLMNYLIGEQRQNTPNLQVVPSDGVDVETAAVREALVKDISLNSNAKVIYQQCFQQAGIGGFSAYALDTDYKNEYSFDLEIIPRGFKDPTVCYWDLGAQSPCKTDGMFGGWRDRMTRKKFKGVYGRKLESQIGADSNYDEGSATGWIFANDDEITIVHDFERVYEKGTIYQLSDARNTVIDNEEFKKLEKVTIDEQELLIYNGEVVSVLNERETHRYRIKYRQMAGDWVLEETDFPSEQLPVVFVDQNSYWDKSGKQICRPFIKDAKDAQRYINYLATNSAYLMKVSRYDQFLVSKANVKSPDTQLIWRDPATAQGGLVYDESPNGNIPIQLRPPELSNSLITQYQRALADIESCTGIYGTQVGEQGNETSGRAIDARSKRGSYNTFIPFDALNRAIACGGQIINEMIPKVYDVQREVRLNMPDRGITPVILNQQMDDYGALIKNDMKKGRYQIRLMPGPSYEGQKQENLESIQTVLQADPSLFRLVADLYVDNLPMANNIEMRNRLRTIVPPEIIQAGKTGEPLPQKPQQPSPEQQAAIMTAQAKMQDAQTKMAEVQRKMVEVQQKAQADQRDASIELQRLETERLEAAAAVQEQELRFQAEIHRTNTDAQISHADNLVKLLTHQPKTPTEKKTI